MRYLCLTYQDESIRQRMPPDEAEQIYGEYYAYVDRIRRDGHYLGSNALQPTAAATTVRVRDGRLSATDGPFAETREQLGGYFLIEAEDMDDALDVAAEIPGARLGCIEVRPILETGA